MIQGLFKKYIFWFTAFGVPLVAFASPSWLKLAGVGPSWVILWLLPWSLHKGSIAGMIAGFSFALIMDGIGFEHYTQLPCLLVLGWWWGQLGERGVHLRKIAFIGLLAWSGSVFLSLNIWLEMWIKQDEISRSLLNEWALHTLFSQAILTALLAPVINSWLLISWGNKRVI